MELVYYLLWIIIFVYKYICVNIYACEISKQKHNHNMISRSGWPTIFTKNCSFIFRFFRSQMALLPLPTIFRWDTYIAGIASSRSARPQNCVVACLLTRPHVPLLLPRVDLTRHRSSRAWLHVRRPSPSRFPSSVSLSFPFSMSVLSFSFQATNSHRRHWLCHVY